MKLNTKTKAPKRHCPRCRTVIDELLMYSTWIVRDAFNLEEGCVGLLNVRSAEDRYYCPHCERRLARLKYEDDARAFLSGELRL